MASSALRINVPPALKTFIENVKSMSLAKDYLVLPQSELRTSSPSSLSFTDLSHVKGSIRSRKLVKILTITTISFFVVVVLLGHKVSRKNGQNVQDKTAVWKSYENATQYFKGLKSLVPYADFVPEYPPSSKSAGTTPEQSTLQIPIAYSPYPRYKSIEYLASHAPVEQCYLDPVHKIAAPDIFVYDGVPQGQAEAGIGSHSLLGLREDICYERYGRYAPYGLGQGHENGGIEAAIDTEHSNVQQIWDDIGGQINYNGIDWHEIQLDCYQRNSKRFIDSNNTAIKKIDRQAVVIRIWTSFPWHELVLINFRAMISELAIKSGGEYDVHFLVHVKDNDLPIWASDELYQAVVNESVPSEFRGMVTLWSEAQMEFIYNKPIQGNFDNPSGQNQYGALRSLHMPLQYFAHKHPEYEHFWNWEMDMRYTGHFYELFDRISQWAAAQPRKELWERNAKYYIPELHGTWQNFTDIVHEENKNGGNVPISGPRAFPGSITLDADYLHSSCAIGSNPTFCGIGQEADLITLNPIFSPNNTAWVFRNDVSGYNNSLPIPPRRAAIVTAGRLSKKLLKVMHEETYVHGHSMFVEMFPASMALHHGLKAVFAPHPVFLDRKWPKEALEKAFNNGVYNSSGGRLESPFSIDNEHYFEGTTWYYNSRFSGKLWRRWFGFIEDGEGGKKADEKEGRMCLRPILLHPIKWELGSVE